MKMRLMLAAVVPALVLWNGAAMAGDAAAGEKVFKKCKTCHSMEAGKNKVGPSLAGVFGTAAGSVEGYKYSKALLESGITWDEGNLDTYLLKPRI